MVYATTDCARIHYQRKYSFRFGASSTVAQSFFVCILSQFVLVFLCKTTQSPFFFGPGVLYAVLLVARASWLSRAGSCFTITIAGVLLILTCLSVSDILISPFCFSLVRSKTVGRIGFGRIQLPAAPNVAPETGSCRATRVGQV